MKHRVALILCLLLSVACGPDERRPGLWLSGETQETFPDDWSFTSRHPEIHIEVSSPYLLPHSVTIWCAEAGGNLYVGARDPDTKNWPGWVDDDPEVQLGIADRIYPVRLEPLTDPAEIATVAQAYAQKYNLSGGTSNDEPVSQRYWRVMPRV
jgi:hypothetical protein